MTAVQGLTGEVPGWILSVAMRLLTIAQRLVVAFALVGAAPVSAQLHDHLKCHRIKDGLTVRGAVDLDALRSEFSDRGCKLRGARLFCSPVSATLLRPGAVSNITGQPLDDDYVCYKLKCPSRIPKGSEISDPLGTRRIRRFDTSLLCMPAVGMSEAKLRWRRTCGDPVCGRPPAAGLRECTTEEEWKTCATENDECGPLDGCNRTLRCLDRDPTSGGCPVSLRAAKRNITYLTVAELEQFHAALLAIPLARWNYVEDPKARPTRLGFVLEDVEAGAAMPAVDVDRGTVDLYGYASVAVAAVQVQARQIEALRAELAELRSAVATWTTCTPEGTAVNR